MESNELKKKNIQTSREEIDYGSVNLRKVAVIGCGFVGSASAFALRLTVLCYSSYSRVL